MIVVRDLFCGARKFGDFLASAENITTNILADRLKRLEKEGLVCKEAYQTNPVRYAYSLTEMGKDLLPLMKAMVKWANRHEFEVIQKRKQPDDRTQQT